MFHYTHPDYMANIQMKVNKQVVIIFLFLFPQIYRQTYISLMFELIKYIYLNSLYFCIPRYFSPIRIPTI